MKYFFLFFVLFTTLFYAQDNRKDWSTEKLTWNDFQGIAVKGDNVSKLKYVLSLETKKKEINDTIYSFTEASAYMDKNLSWVHKDQKNNQSLRYNQVIFNLAELHRRKLQLDLNQMNSVYELDLIFDKHFSNLNNKIAQFQKQSKKGNSLPTIEIWEVLTDDKLKEYPSKDVLKFKNNKVGLGMFIGLGSGMFTNSLQEHFTNNVVNLTYGFDVAYKKHTVFLNGSISFNKVKKEFIDHETTWLKDKKTTLALVDVSYGYPIIDNSKLRLIPFIGLGITELTSKNTEEDKDLKLVDYNLIFGLNADYKFKKIVSLTPSVFSGGKEYKETAIRVKLFASKVNYSDNLNGYSVNLSVGISWFMHQITLE